MVILEYILLSSMICLGILCSITDIKRGIIPNKLLLLFVAGGIFLDVIYYGFIARDLFVLFIMNFMSTTVLALCLYYTHAIAGGDCKLIPVMSALYPAGMYLSYDKNNVTLFVAVLTAILIGYCFLLLRALWRIIKGENRISGKYLKESVISYLKAYGRALVYVVFVNLAFVLIGKYLTVVWQWAVLLILMIVAWMSGSVRFLKKRAVLLSVLAIDVGLSVYLRMVPVSINPRSYLLTAVLMLCQMAIRTDLYETIPTVHVRKGMILSSASSVAMQLSKVKGLPGLSAEDLRNRLTEEEADSIHRWGKTPNGQNSITIVKKIPFAIFILLGYLSYFVVWRVLI